MVTQGSINEFILLSFTFWNNDSSSAESFFLFFLIFSSNSWLVEFKSVVVFIGYVDFEDRSRFAIDVKFLSDIVGILLNHAEMGLSEVFAEVFVGHVEYTIVSGVSLTQELRFIACGLDSVPKIMVILVSLPLPFPLAPWVPDFHHSVMSPWLIWEINRIDLKINR